MAEEPGLHGGLNEDAESLLERHDLERVIAGRVNGRGLESDGREGTS